MYDSVAFSTFAMLCNYYLYLAQVVLILRVRFPGWGSAMRLSRPVRPGSVTSCWSCAPCRGRAGLLLFALVWEAVGEWWMREVTMPGHPKTSFKREVPSLAHHRPLNASRFRLHADEFVRYVLPQCAQTILHTAFSRQHSITHSHSRLACQAHTHIFPHTTHAWRGRISFMF